MIRSLIAVVVVMWMAVITGCVVQTEPVKGDKGDPGTPGFPDSKTISDMQKSIDELKAKVDTLEAQVGSIDCPPGYDTTAKPFLPTRPDSVLCVKDGDEVVRVGSTGAAFWIDRYEASIWNDGNQYFASQDDSNTDSTFSKNGETSQAWMARSVSDVLPARFVTWFQARAACRAAGKRLPGREEWLTAERGTTDPDVSDGSKNTKCNTKSSVSAPRPAGGAGDPASTPINSGCFSDWGAEDMIGNLWEWTDEWYASIGHLALSGGAVEASTDSLVPWVDSSLYRNDVTSGVLSSAFDGDAQDPSPGLPSAAFRGGDWGAGSGAGAFALIVKNGPSHWHSQVGFRCIIPK